MATVARDPAVVEHANEVRLVGRLSSDPAERELPSGDVVITFRLVVARDQVGRAGESRAPTVDTIECAAWTKGAQRSARSCRVGDLLEVNGALRRRFWRAGTTTASRSEVEVVKVRRRVRAQDG